MSVATISASQPFLDSVANAWIERVGLHDAAGDDAPLGGVILVPGRRAGRALMEAFLRVLDGRPALLPAIMALGDVDDESLFALRLDGALPPAVEPICRLAVLARLILSAPLFRTVSGQETGTLERVWPLARSLADLMDDAERNSVDLAAMLPQAVQEEEFAQHWEQTLIFLQIITQAWPHWLAEEDVSNPIARQVALLRAQAEAWHDHTPRWPVWAVGFVDGSAGVADALKAVAALPQGVVLLQGLDNAMQEDLWCNLPETHPQFLFRELLDEIGVSRAEVTCWGRGHRPSREQLFRHVMVPEAGIACWGEVMEAPDIEGLFRLPAEDPQQEAQAIALLLRDVASSPGRSAALVTPDRGLAQRVRAELLRFGIHADDSAGEPLQRTPAAVFLRLVAEAFEAGFPPVALLAVLKHPLAALGMTPGRCRALARLLERAALRGPAPSPGMAGLRAALMQETYGKQCRDDSPEDLEDFLERLAHAFAPLVDVGQQASVPALLEALVRTAEALATTEEEKTANSETRPGERLWLGDDGAMLSQHLAALMVHTAVLPPQPVNTLAAFLTASMAGKSLTGLRGHQGGVELAHPRISILGVLEARLLAFDTVILGGLNETVWPPATDPGPWLSRPMRRAVGLPSPERQIGASAHDFMNAALGAGTVVLSFTQRRDGSPAVPTRWLVRLEAFLAGQDGGLVPVHPALQWQQQLDLPAGEACPVLPPEPRPPLVLRPRRLSITAIDTLKTDPYAIYARHVLHLHVLPPLEQGVEHVDYGLIVHRGLERMFQRFPTVWPQDAQSLLYECFEAALAERASISPALRVWWRSRLRRIADWVLEKESERLADHAPWRSATEVEARYSLEGLPGGDFTISGRADRIDLAEGGDEGSFGTLPIARIFDYKTGQLPTGKDVEIGWESQMVLEAALLAKGAFKGLGAASVVRLVYWRLSGGAEAGKETEIPPARSTIDLDALVSHALENVRSLLEGYDDPDQPYRSQPWAGRVPRHSDYTQLARVEEWRNAAPDDA